MRQGYERFKLISTFKKFYGRHKTLVDRYRIYVTHIISAFTYLDLHVIRVVFYVCLSVCVFSYKYAFLQWVVYKFR